MMDHTGLGMHYANGVPRSDEFPPVLALLSGSEEAPAPYGYASLAMTKAPGTRFGYSGGGFLVLQHLIECREGRPAAEVSSARLAGRSVPHLRLAAFAREPGDGGLPAPLRNRRAPRTHVRARAAAAQARRLRLLRRATAGVISSSLSTPPSLHPSLSPPFPYLAPARCLAGASPSRPLPPAPSGRQQGLPTGCAYSRLPTIGQRVAAPARTWRRRDSHGSCPQCCLDPPAGAISHAAARAVLTPSAAGDLGSDAFMGAAMGVGMFVFDSLGADGRTSRWMLHQAANDGFRGVLLVCFDGPDAAEGPRGFVILANGDNAAVNLVSAVARRLLCAPRGPFARVALDWSRVPDPDVPYLSRASSQEEIVNLGLKEQVLNAFVKPAAGPVLLPLPDVPPTKSAHDVDQGGA